MAQAKKLRAYVDHQRWTIEHVRLRSDRHGECDWQKRTIRVHETLAGVALMDALLHELLHARFWDLDEGAVNEFASVAAAILDREGFRQPDDHEED